MSEPYQTDVTLPELTRGSKYRFRLYSYPTVSQEFDGKVGKVTVDHPTAGADGRLTITEAVGTGSDDYADDVTCIVHADDESYLTVTISTADGILLGDGADYVVTFKLDDFTRGKATLPVRTPPGGTN